MTAVLVDTTGAAWDRQPAWGIVADLTPPELLDARRLKNLRKRIAATLVLVVLLCAAAYTMAVLDEHRATSALNASHARAGELAAQRVHYQYVTDGDVLTQRVNSELATLTANQVDVARLLATLRKAVPGTMSLTSMNISVTGAAPGTVATPSLNISGLAVIGTVTMTGSSQHLVDLATYVNTLSALKGVVNVWPATNTRSENGTATWSISLQITTGLLVHGTTTATGGN